MFSRMACSHRAQAERSEGNIKSQHDSPLLSSPLLSILSSLAPFIWQTPSTHLHFLLISVSSHVKVLQQDSNLTDKHSQNHSSREESRDRKHTLGRCGRLNVLPTEHGQGGVEAHSIVIEEHALRSVLVREPVRRRIDRVVCHEAKPKTCYDMCEDEEVDREADDCFL